MDPKEDIAAKSTCTSCTFTEDLSNYWTAVMYFRSRNGTLKRVPQMANIGRPMIKGLKDSASDASTTTALAAHQEPAATPVISLRDPAPEVFVPTSTFQPAGMVRISILPTIEAMLHSQQMETGTTVQLVLRLILFAFLRFSWRLCGIPDSLIIRRSGLPMETSL